MAPGPLPSEPPACLQKGPKGAKRDQKVSAPDQHLIGLCTHVEHYIEHVEIGCSHDIPFLHVKHVHTPSHGGTTRDPMDTRLGPLGDRTCSGGVHLGDHVLTSCHGNIRNGSDRNGVRNI